MVRERRRIGTVWLAGHSWGNTLLARWFTDTWRAVGPAVICNIYLRRCDPDGVPEGAKIQVNMPPAAWGAKAEVAASTEGPSLSPQFLNGCGFCPPIFWTGLTHNLWFPRQGDPSSRRWGLSPRLSFAEVANQRSFKWRLPAPPELKKRIGCCFHHKSAFRGGGETRLLGLTPHADTHTRRTER